MSTDMMPPRTDAAKANRVRRVRISREMYALMARKGMFGPDRRVELIDGRIYEMPAMENPHRLVLSHIDRLLVKTLPATWHSTSQCPIVLDEFGEPEPDIAVIRGKMLDYRDRKPAAADIGLVVEVSDATLPHDRRRKLRAYAEAGIPEYWIVNLPERIVEVRTEPRAREGKTRGTYAVLHVYRGEEKVPLRLDGQTIAEFPVTELIPL